MSAITMNEKWLAEKSRLKQIKKESRELEMIVDEHIEGFDRMQFSRDVEVYGVYEAVLYLSSRLTEDGVNRLKGEILAM